MCSTCTEWNCDTNRGDHLCHKSIQQIRPLAPAYKNEWRINEINYAPIASTICGGKTKHTRFKRAKPIRNLQCYFDQFSFQRWCQQQVHNQFLYSPFTFIHLCQGHSLLDRFEHSFLLHIFLLPLFDFPWCMVLGSNCYRAWVVQ